MKVGFIGLGNQGSPIARRIARSGFALIACDHSERVLAAFDEPNVERLSDPLETARRVDVLLARQSTPGWFDANEPALVAMLPAAESLIARFARTMEEA